MPRKKNSKKKTKRKEHGYGVKRTSVTRVRSGPVGTGFGNSKLHPYFGKPTTPFAKSAPSMRSHVYQPKPQRTWLESAKDWAPLVYPGAYAASLGVDVLKWGYNKGAGVLRESHRAYNDRRFDTMQRSRFETSYAAQQAAEARVENPAFSDIVADRLLRTTTDAAVQQAIGAGTQLAIAGLGAARYALGWHADWHAGNAIQA